MLEHLNSVLERVMPKLKKKNTVTGGESVTGGGLVTRRTSVIELIRQMATEDTTYGRIGLVFVADLLKRLHEDKRNWGWLISISTFQCTLLSYDREKLVELRPWSGTIKELGYTAIYCLRAIDGTHLALIRPIEREDHEN